MLLYSALWFRSLSTMTVFLNSNYTTMVIVSSNKDDRSPVFIPFYSLLQTSRLSLLTQNCLCECIRMSYKSWFITWVLWNANTQNKHQILKYFALLSLYLLDRTVFVCKNLICTCKISKNEYFEKKPNNIIKFKDKNR